MFDYTYLLVLLGFFLSTIASAVLKSTVKKYSRVLARRHRTGTEVARILLNSADIGDVEIGRISGSLTDHYSPKEKILRLSDSVYNSPDIASIGIAAHECGHAIQHHRDFWLMGIRNMAVPVANIGSKLSYPVILVGLLFSLPKVITAGLYLFLLVVIFELITLPVELDASHRALRELKENCILDEDELSGARKVLIAAAFTYVAGLATALLQFFRLFLLFGNNRRR